MKVIDKVIVNTDKRIITLYLKPNENSSDFDIINYEFSKRFKLVVDTIERTKIEKPGQYKIQKNK